MSDEDGKVLKFRPATPPEPALTIGPPPVNVTFTNPDGTIVGQFQYNNDTRKWSFEGDMDESAQKFMDFLLSLFDQRPGA